VCDPPPGHQRHESENRRGNVTGRGGREATRVLLFVDNFDCGGTESQLVELANALAADPGLEVHVGCHRRGPLIDKLHLPDGRIRDYSFHRFYSTGGVRQITRLARDIIRRGFDIVHAQDFYANVTCTAAAGWQNSSKLIVSRRYEIRSNRRVHRWGEKWCYRLADAVVLNSRSIADQLIERRVLRASKVFVIPNGVDIQRFAANSGPVGECGRRPEQRSRIGVVARLHPVKGHVTFLHAVSRLVSRWPQLEAVLIGDGTLHGDLEELSRRLGISEHVTFLGHQDDVSRWLPSFDVAVLPSMHEGFPNALLEYLAAGRPVVASRVGGIPDMVTSGREALLVSPGEPDKLAEAIDRVLSDGTLRAALARAGRERAERYSLKRMVAEIRRLYAMVLTSPMRSGALEAAID